MNYGHYFELVTSTFTFTVACLHIQSANKNVCWFSPTPFQLKLCKYFSCTRKSSYIPIICQTSLCIVGVVVEVVDAHFIHCLHQSTITPSSLFALYLVTRDDWNVMDFLSIRINECMLGEIVCIADIDARR